MLKPIFSRTISQHQKYFFENGMIETFYFYSGFSGFRKKAFLVFAIALSWLTRSLLNPCLGRVAAGSGEDTAPGSLDEN
jgi:hypothetical protein